jgi:hypothetical protein
LSQVPIALLAGIAAEANAAMDAKRASTTNSTAIRAAVAAAVEALLRINERQMQACNPCT